MRAQKKIKIPAAVNGIEAEGKNYSTSIIPKYEIKKAGIDEIIKPYSQEDLMPTRNDKPISPMNISKPTKTKIDIGTLSEGIGFMTDLFGSKSTAYDSSDSIKQSVGSIFNGAATGAKIGSAFGPMGQGIGAVAGAGIGLIGKSGQEAKMTSFTDYDEGTLGTGLMGLGNGKLRDIRRRIKKNAFVNRESVRGTGDLQEQYYEDTPYVNNDILSAEFGGYTNSKPIYVDDGEYIKSTNGNISKVPEQGKPTDSNLILSQSGDRVLSDSLKVPGTKYTFAQMYDKMKSKESNNKDVYAQNSNKLNSINNQQLFDKLFEVQEVMKNKKGIKPKYKKMIPAAKNGIFNMSTLDGIVNALPLLDKAKAETVNSVYNPYSTAIQRAMRRKFDPSALLRDIVDNRTISNYSLSQSNTNTGASLAAYTQSAVDLAKRVQDIRQQESNINNQYLGEYANTLNNLGQQWVAATNLAEDLNARNRGAADTWNSQQMANAIKGYQTYRKDRNAELRDRLLWPMMKEYLRNGFTSQQIDELQNLIKFK